jgi:ubiquinone/menaquinone biosynthesis C-methylase UbiE
MNQLSPPHEACMHENPSVPRTLDPEGAHLDALLRLADFRGRQVLEMGCGDGRLTAGIAAEAGHVLAFDPDAESVAEGRRLLPVELSERVALQAASAQEIEIERGAFDLVVFSWSL